MATGGRSVSRICHALTARVEHDRGRLFARLRAESWATRSAARRVSSVLSTMSAPGPPVVGRSLSCALPSSCAERRDHRMTQGIELIAALEKESETTGCGRETRCEQSKLCEVATRKRQFRERVVAVGVKTRRDQDPRGFEFVDHGRGGFEECVLRRRRPLRPGVVAG